MKRWWGGLRLGTRFMIVNGIGISGLVCLWILAIAGLRVLDAQRELHRLSVSELTSLEALIVDVMSKRPEDGDNIGIRVFNDWFESRNRHFPGQVWSTWGPKVTRHMAEVAPDHAPKHPRDQIDREALESREPVGRFSVDAYRYSVPIVLGRTKDADPEVCRSCHTALMGIEDGEVIAVLSSSLSLADAKADLYRVIAWLAIGGLLATAIGVMCVRWLLGLLITNSITDMTERMERLAQGDAGIEISGVDRRDEVGAMARAVEVFKRNSIANRQLEEAARVESAAKEARVHRLTDMIASFEKGVSMTLGQLGTALARMAETAQQMVGYAQAASRSTELAATNATETNDNVRVIAAAAEELSHSIGEITRQVAKSTEVSADASRSAADVSTKVEGLTSAAARVGDVLSTISVIAKKTNILALNATIEAVRAGEAGRGFAIVAGEVKTLADSTMRATDEISGQVDGIQCETGQTVEAIRAIVETIGDIDSAATAIAAAIEQQEASTQEIANNIERAAAGVAAVNENIEQAGRTVVATDNAAREVLGAVAEVQAHTAALKADVEVFLEGIRDN